MIDPLRTLKIHNIPLNTRLTLKYTLYPKYTINPKIHDIPYNTRYTINTR